MRWFGRVAGVLVLIGSVADAQITTPLIDAVKAADVRAVQDILRRDPASVNTAALDGTTALYWAAERDETSILGALLKAGADARMKSRYGVSPLALAAANGNGEMVGLLLGAGADPHAGLSEGETALMTAARTGKAGALKQLLAYGADVNARTPGGQTALMWAAARNNADAVRVLVEAGADLTVRTNNPGPVRMSIFNSPPPTGFTALLFASRAGSIEAVKALLDAGADVNDELSGGESALLVATANAHWELAGLLLDRGANPNAARAGWNALHQAVRSRRPNLFYSPGPIATGTVDSLDFIKKLIAKGVDVDARMMKNGMKDGQRNRINRLGATAFFLAAKGTDFELMKVLVQAGADPKMPSADGTTPLMVAAGLGIWYVGEDAGSLPGQEAEVLEAVKLCARLGNGVNDANLAGETPMHGAAFRGVNEVVEFLVDQGARLDPRDVRGWTPFTIANGITHGDVFKQQPHTAALIEKLLAARGLSAAGQAADGTECLDCIQTRDDQAQAALDRDRRMEAEFAKTEAARLSR
jgi:ankyrin repeat protein